MVFKKMRPIKNLLSLKNLVLALSILTLLAVSVIIGVNQGGTEVYIGTVPSDVVSYNTLLEPPLASGDIYANGIHTFLLKYPLILLQNLFGLNLTSLTVMAVLMMLAMNGGMAYLIWRFSGRNKSAATVGILALISIELLTNVNYYFMSLSWITVRNIEIPLMILLSVLALRANLKFWQKSLVALGLALNFVNDRLTMYYLAAGLVLFLLLSLWRNRKTWIKSSRNLLEVSAGAMMLSFIIEMVLNGTGLLKFAYTYPSTVSMVDSFGQFFDTLKDGAQSLFYVFGADIWNSQFWQAPLYLIQVGLIGAALFVVYKIVRNFIKSKDTTEMTEEKASQKVGKLSKKVDFYNHRAIVLLICYAAASFGCYALLFHTQGLGVDARFLIFIPFIAVLAISFALRNWQPNFDGHLKKIIATVIVVAYLVGGFITMNTLYTRHTARLDEAKFAYQTTIDILNKEDIHVLAGGYPYLHTIKFIYDQNSDQKLDIPIMLDKKCNIADSKSAKKSWFEPGDNNTRTALFSLLLPCSEEQITQIYGQPATKYLIVDSVGQQQATVYVFEYDIRTKFDMSQFQ